MSNLVKNGLTKASPQRIEELIHNYNHITSLVTAAAKKFNRDKENIKVLPVSKFKPANDILALYEEPELKLRHFGENYIQELIEKSSILPADIQWHFIGALQSNKIKHLASIKNLYMVESLSELKKIKSLNDHRKKNSEESNDFLKTRILLQINTSEEPQKAGILYSDTNKIFEVLSVMLKECDHLTFSGLMTIGSTDQSKNNAGENEDFRKLVDIKKQILAKFSDEFSENDIELSMGMSSDFEEAIRQGSNEIRIGTNIFGARDYSNKTH